MTARVFRAVDKARAGAKHPGLTLNLVRRVAIGDPQAPLEHFLSILDSRALLGDDGWLKPSVHLVSMGDHFDYGGAKDWRAAAADGFALLSWLGAHPDDQVTLLLGNHDSARVGELAELDDAAFGNARDAAVAIYTGKKRDPSDPAEAAFLRAFPSLPSSELAARDFSAFETRQRELVTRLLRERRFRLATHFSGALLTHAGVSTRELDAVGARSLGAGPIAKALNTFLDGQVKNWSQGPLDLTPLHHHGDGSGEGGGMLYQRATRDSGDQDPRRRRFGVRELPRGLTQIIGHVRDKKSRELLGLDPAGAVLGSVRSLCLTDAGFDYRLGVAPGAEMIFLDGGMKDCAAADYQLLDLDTLQPG